MIIKKKEYIVYEGYNSKDSIPKPTDIECELPEDLKYKKQVVVGYRDLDGNTSHYRGICIDSIPTEVSTLKDYLRVRYYHERPYGFELGFTKYLVMLKVLTRNMDSIEIPLAYNKELEGIDKDISKEEVSKLAKVIKPLLSYIYTLKIPICEIMYDWTENSNMNMLGVSKCCNQYENTFKRKYGYEDNVDKKYSLVFIKAKETV